jgi:hypothetical protein
MKAIPPFRGQPIPFSESLVRGAIGKAFVIKHYKKGKIIKTKYPDMQGIKPSSKQKISRRTFRKAVAFAQAIYWNPEKKAEWKAKLRKPRRLFQALMKVYYKQKAERAFRNQQRLNKWRRTLQSNGGVPAAFTYTNRCDSSLLITPACRLQLIANSLQLTAFSLPLHKHL